MQNIMLIGLGVAFIGVAVAIGAWLAPPGTIEYPVRFGLVTFAVIVFIVGAILIVIGCFPLRWIAGFLADRKSAKELQRTANLFYGKQSWMGRLRDWSDRCMARLCEIPPGYISIKEAARKLYEAAKAGKIPLGEASEKLSGWSGNGPAQGSPEDILHWWAGHISKELVVYGRKPPSFLFEEIPRRDVNHFIFFRGGHKAKRSNS